MVGTVRFELTTSSTPRKRATKLRYVPTKRIRMRADSMTQKTEFNNFRLRPVIFLEAKERR